MTRRPRPVLPSLVALALIADATMCTRIAWHSTSLAAWLGASALGWSAVMGVWYALATVWHAVDYRAKRRRDRRPYRPSGRPQPGTGRRPVAPVDGRHARAALPTHDGWTVTMPVVKTPRRDWAGATR
jgi:hypothetical protein